MPLHPQSWTFLWVWETKNTDRYPVVLLVSIDFSGRLDSAITRYMPILLIQCHLDLVPLFGLPFSLPPLSSLFLPQKSMFMNPFFSFNFNFCTAQIPLPLIMSLNVSHLCCIMSWFLNQIFDHLNLNRRVLVKTDGSCITSLYLKNTILCWPLQSTAFLDTIRSQVPSSRSRPKYNIPNPVTTRHPTSHSYKVELSTSWWWRTEWNTRFGRDVLIFWMLLKVLSFVFISRPDNSTSAISCVILESQA